MATNSLRISNVDGTLNEAGYIEIVEKIILDRDGFEDFTGEDEDDGKFTKARTGMLKKHAEVAGGLLQQKDNSGGVESVTRTNCRIRAKPDVRRQGGNGFSKVTVTMPEEPLAISDLDYIDDYITKYLEIRSGAPLPPATSQAAARRARKFVFGMMMLTRCR